MLCVMCGMCFACVLCGVAEGRGRWVRHMELWPYWQLLQAAGWSFALIRVRFVQVFAGRLVLVLAAAGADFQQQQ